MPDSSTGLPRRVLHAQVRQAVLVLVSIASMAGAGAALWTWLSPETIQATATISLFALLALLFLPVATLAALEADRRRTHEQRAIRAAVVSPATPPNPAPVATPAPSPASPARVREPAPPTHWPVKIYHHTAIPQDRPTTSRRRRVRPAPEYSPAALPR